MKALNLTPWASDVVESLQKLGGQGTASEIASKVKTLTRQNRKTNDWKSSVLNVLNDNCSTKVDYKRIKARKPDHPALFIDLGNRGSERLWGLNSSIFSDSELQTGSVNKTTDNIPTQKIDHETWAKIALAELVNHIKNYTGGNKYITYGDLAKRINYPAPHTGNLFGLQIGRTLGVMGHLFDGILIDGESIPLIQALVVSSGSKLPSDGLKEFNKTYPELSNEKKKDFAQIEYDKIFKFGAKWDKVLQELDIEPDPASSPDTSNRSKYNPYGSEGSPEHRKLRDFIANNSSMFNLPADVKGIVEYPLKSGDSVDVVFELSDRIVAVEVKSLRSNQDDIERGIYQCIKYKAVLDAEDLSKNNGKKITSHLVIQNKLPVALLKLKNKLNVNVIDQITPI